MTDFAFPSSRLTEQSVAAPRRARRLGPACPTGFAIFLLLNAVLFIRPSDILEDLRALPIYEGLILLCAVASLPAMLASLTGKALPRNPGLTCVIGLLGAIIMASAVHLQFWSARANGMDFLKILIYFILLVSLINTRHRLDLFLQLLLGLTAITAFLSLLTYHGIVNIQALSPIDQHMGFDENGELISVPRLVGPGIFNDPNDFSIILVSGLVIVWKLWHDSKNPLRYPLLAAAAAAMGFAFFYTRSRGGFLSLIAAVTVILIGRYGWKRTSLASLVLLPVLFSLSGGRQTDISLSSGDTAQGRILLWRDSLVLFHHSPIFGIGGNQLEEVNQLVAHNSYVQAFAELGLVGGTLFVGAFFVPVYSLIQQSRPCNRLIPDRPNHTAIALLAILIGYAVGLYSLTRTYTVSTYVIIGVAVAGSRLLAIEMPATRLVWTKRLALNIALASFGCLLWLEAFFRIFVA